RDPTRQSLDLLHVSGIDSLLAEVLDGRWTEEVAAHARDHKNLRATQTRRYCLIRALAAEAEIEFLSENSFAGLGELIGERRQVNVGAANYRNSRALRHSRRIVSE